MSKSSRASPIFAGIVRSDAAFIPTSVYPWKFSPFMTAAILFRASWNCLRASVCAFSASTRLGLAKYAFSAVINRIPASIHDRLLWYHERFPTFKILSCNSDCIPLILLFRENVFLPMAGLDIDLATFGAKILHRIHELALVL